MRSFLGLGMDEAVSDGTTHCPFRGHLVAWCLADRLPGEIARWLVEQGLVPRQGKPVDADPIAVDTAVRKGLEARTVTSDLEFGSSGRRGKLLPGDTMRVAVDSGPGLMWRPLLTPADLHEVAVAEAAVQGDEPVLTGHKGYGTGPFRRAIRRAWGVERLRMCGR